jgi:hypothetical protein
LLIDENLSSQLVVEAHEHGHGARWVDSMPGRSDRAMLDERRTLGERLVIRDGSSSELCGLVEKLV